MRCFILLVSLLFASVSWAQTPQAPKNLQPLPEPPPPPPGMESDPALEPQVTITKRGTDTVEEYRLKGQLYMVKVTPQQGKPYYLIDRRGDGRFVRQDDMDNGMRPPMWLIHQF